jgi:hypothetical protein
VLDATQQRGRERAELHADLQQLREQSRSLGPGEETAIMDADLYTPFYSVIATLLMPGLARTSQHIHMAGRSQGYLHIPIWPS